MSERFAKKWEAKRDEQAFGDRIKDAVNPPGPLKPRLDFAVRRIELQVQKLDQANERFSQRDKAIFAHASLTHTPNTTVHAQRIRKRTSRSQKNEQTHYERQNSR
jgi:hypothetical protein